jgi:hypothetical protein
VLPGCLFVPPGYLLGASSVPLWGLLEILVPPGDTDTDTDTDADTDTDKDTDTDTETDRYSKRYR